MCPTQLKVAQRAHKILLCIVFHYRGDCKFRCLRVKVSHLSTVHEKGLLWVLCIIHGGVAFLLSITVAFVWRGEVNGMCSGWTNASGFLWARTNDHERSRGLVLDRVHFSREVLFSSISLCVSRSTRVIRSLSLCLSCPIHFQSLSF